MNKLAFFLGTAITLLALSCGNNETNTSSNSITNDTNVIVDSQDFSSDEVYLTDDDLLGLSIPELRIERNTIFAKHGYIFKSSELTQYFSQFDWYNPQYNNVDDMLTDADKQNIDLIKHYETEKQSKKIDFDTFLTLFEEIDKPFFEVTWDYYNNFELNPIIYRYLAQFFDIDTAMYEDGCNFITYIAVSKFNIPNSNNIGLFTISQICPVPAIHEETQLWIFDPFGNLIDNTEIAYSRGGSGDIFNATSVFKNEEFIQTEIEYVDDRINGGINETITKKQKISFKPITSQIIIEQL